MRRDPFTRALVTERDQLLERLAELEQQAHRAAQVMYRRGYQAGHTAQRRQATTSRGPYKRTPA